MNTQQVWILVAVVAAFLVGQWIVRPEVCLAGCQQPESVGPGEFQTLSKQEGVVVLDVRTKEEFEAGAIAGAVNLDWNDQETFREGLKSLDARKHHLIYCRSGNRSAQALEYMRKNGFSQLTHLENGILSWQRAGLPLQ